MADFIDDIVSRLTMEFSRMKEAMYEEALNHFGITYTYETLLDHRDRVELRYDNGKEELYVDGVLAVTFYPMEMTSEHNISIKYKEHYKEGNQ